MAGSETGGAIAHPKDLFYILSYIFPSRSFLLSRSPCWDSELSENSSKILWDLHNSTLLGKNMKLEIIYFVLVVRSTGCN